MTSVELQNKCKEIRRSIISMIANASSGHPGGSLSIVEILVALYYQKMRIDPSNPTWEDRDRFVLSKGHGAPAYYAVLCDKGYFPQKELSTFRQLHSSLQGHPDSLKCPGVDVSTGSLGQGAAIAVGIALGAKLDGKKLNVYALCGDGELQEGVIWEAAMAASHYQLNHLTLLIDRNGLQIDGKTDDVMGLGNLATKFQSFGFDVLEVDDGNNVEKILDALNQPLTKRPRVILCHTTKGKGVSFMENQVDWHGKAPNSAQRLAALREIGGANHV